MAPYSLISKKYWQELPQQDDLVAPVSMVFIVKKMLQFCKKIKFILPLEFLQLNQQCCFQFWASERVYPLQSNC